MKKRIPSRWLLPVMRTRLSPRKREKNSKLKKAVSGLYILAPPLSFSSSVNSTYPK